MRSENNHNRRCTTCFLANMLFIGFIGINPVADAGEGVWALRTEMPTKRLMTGGGVVNGKVYVMGGAPDNFTVTSAVEMYDPRSDSWTELMDMPSGRCGPASCVFEDKIYFFGGVHSTPYAKGTKSVFVYDPETDSWAQKGDMPYPNAWSGVSVINDTIYLVGGMLSVMDPPVSTVLAYNPYTDSWVRKKDMPTARGALSCQAVGGKIYAMGGAKEDWSVSAFNRVEVYNPAADSWVRKSDMPTHRWGLGTCVMNNKIYAIGGRSGADVCAVNEVYDPKTDTWVINPPMGQKRNGPLVCSIDGRVYVIGGVYIHPQETFLATVEEYGPSPLVVDFNGDGIVDTQDLLRLIQVWGQDSHTFDLAPAFGDGVVDVLDLEAFMQYWGREVDDPTLLACWKMDEVVGKVAYDSAATNDAVLIDNPQWQPEGGQINGALLFDGQGDFLTTPFILDPAEGAFSVFCWMHAGAPGQVLISQLGGNNWLMADKTTGVLRTDLTIPPSTIRGNITYGLPLISEAVITDGNWHRIGFVWDGANRTLYVDNVEVAYEQLESLNPANDGIIIGAGADLEPGSFFSGLIDDVRIYNRAVIP